MTSTRFPDELAREPLQGAVWLGYLQDAVQRETGSRPNLLRQDWQRFFRDLVADGLDPWLLACALDLLALRWVKLLPRARAVLGDDSTADPWLIARLPVLLGPMRSATHRPPSYWRHVWLSRLCENADEARFCRRWLGAVEDALDEFEVIDHEMLERAEERLAAVEPQLRRHVVSFAHLHYLKDLL
jgi:hypothetical protein